MFHYGAAVHRSLKITDVPPPLPLVAAVQRQEDDWTLGYRPDGTDDWLLVGTLAGYGYVRSSKGTEQRLRRGSLFLVAPRLHQEYGNLEERGNWTNVWIHFRPRPHWLPWLDWPHSPADVGFLQWRGDVQTMEDLLLSIVEAANSDARLRYEVAMNLLERVLLSCHDMDSRRGHVLIDRRIQAAISFIDERLHDDVSVQEISDTVGLSRSRFSVLFRAQLGTSPQAYIEKVRLEKASHMLLSSHDTVSKVAEKVGFTNPYYFSTRFRLHFGMTPSQYRGLLPVGSSGLQHLNAKLGPRYELKDKIAMAEPGESIEDLIEQVGP